MTFSIVGSVMRIWVYILICADDSFYVGSHRGPDPVVREAEHNDGLDRYAYTYARRPVRLVWTEEFEDPTQAVAFERKLKGWSRAKKEAVIRGDWQSLPGLARRRSRPSDESPKPRGVKNQ
jgi:putative endonuclease